MRHHSKGKKTVSRFHLTALAVVFAVAGSLYALDNSRTHRIADAEPRFADTSRSGLEIIPASGGSYGEGAYYGYGQATYYGYGQATYYGYGQATYYGYGQATYYGYGQATYYGYGQSTYTATYVPTCTVTITPNPINRGAGATVTWSSTNATSLTLNTIGPVALTGSTSVSPAGSTSYGGTVSGPGGSNTCPATLTVNNPTASFTVNGGASAQTVNVGGSTTWVWSSTFGSTYGTTFTLNSPDSCGNGVGPNAWSSGNTSSGSFGYTWTTCSAGRTYTYTYKVTNSAGFAVTSTATVTVNPLPQCSLSLTANPILRGSNSGLSWTSSNSTSGTINPGAISATPVSSGGPVSVAPSATTTYTGTFTGAGGSNTCSVQLNVYCAPIYSCSGQQIQYTDAGCNTTNVGAACTSPRTCQAGQSTCYTPPPTFTAAGSLSGHLEANPRLTRYASTTRLYWNISNVQTCTVKGTNGDSFAGGCAGNACTSGASGIVTSPITSSVNYVLNCTALAGATPSSLAETITVLPTPQYQER